MEEKKLEKKGLNVSTRSYITALAVIFVLMLLTFILTSVIPGGEFTRTVNEQGQTVVADVNDFHEVEGGIPFWKWILSPFLVLGSNGSSTIISVIAFLLIIGGGFASIEKSGLMKYMLARITAKFGDKKYKLLAIVTLFFMAMGSLIGSFEECVPLVPIVVSLCVGLGWDAVTGLAASILAAGCGFAAGICNPFTVGVAQELIGLPAFSGIWLRVVTFVLIYALLISFILFHAKRIEKPVDTSVLNAPRDRLMDSALLGFCLILGVGILMILSSSFLTFLQDYTMIIVCLIFLLAGIIAPLIPGGGFKNWAKNFFGGIVGILPAVLMILMASSIKYTLEEGRILDTVLRSAYLFAGTLPRWMVILFIYLFVMLMNFFIASGSAKAFLLMPIIAPLGEALGVPAQLCVLAFAFGDGFTNVFYPTNPILLISLGLSDISYGKWARWSGKFQLANLALTSLVLLFGLAIGYC